MDPVYYDAFLDAEANGLKQQAKMAIEAFVNSFSSIEEKRAWTVENIERLMEGDKWRTRHELYEDVIFPALYADHQAGGEWGTIWLVKTSGNLNQNMEQWAMLDHATETQLLEEALKIHPTSTEMRALLLKHMLSQFDYHVHEWPTGILVGMNGASIEDCDIFLERAAVAKALCDTSELEARVTEFVQLVHIYKKRLQTND